MLDEQSSLTVAALGDDELVLWLEAILMAAGRPLTVEQLLAIFTEAERPDPATLKTSLEHLQERYRGRGIEVLEVASGYRFQVQARWAPWVARLWEEKPGKYSRALLETLSLIAYRQPITRGEIEDIRGVVVSTSIIKTLLEDRNWVRVVGHRNVPGRPALYATTRQFLDYFGLKTLDQLPPLVEMLANHSHLIDAENAVAKVLEIPAVTHELPENTQVDDEYFHNETVLETAQKEEMMHA